MVDVASVRARYEAERPLFEILAKAAADTFRHEAAVRNVPCQVEYRAKEAHSLVKKVIFGRTKYNSVIDRAGVRLILRSVDDRKAADAIVRAAFKVHKQIDAADRLEAREFGYGGIHYYLEFLEPPEEPLSGLRFECQVHTRAQALWAKLSHELAYKGSEEGLHTRSLHRLAALLELVDLEVVRIQEQAGSEPGQTAARVAAVLEGSYLVVGKRRHSPEVTASLIPLLLPLMGTDDLDRWRADFEAFIGEHAARLADIYDRYSADARHVMLSQPESLLVLYARQRDPFSFDDRWPAELGDGLKESFIGIWPNP